MPIPPVPTSGCTRREEIDRRCACLRMDLLYGPRYAIESPLWDTWLHNEHDLRQQSFFVGRPPSPSRPCRAREESPPKTRGHRRVRGLTLTPSSSPSLPLPPPMTEEEEEAELM
ncbi:hypothetical protein D1007_12776 [Hordeum vulgare]|nr:hypothetical protein D1007_12776 [Hordeum vulgare]